MAPDIIVLIILYSALAITGLLGNCWVLITVLTQLLGFGNAGRSPKPTIQSSAYIYLLLLSVVDLISLMPVPIVVSDLHENRFLFGNVLCRLMYICEAANKTLSPMVLTALSIDRYIAICRPKLVWMRQTRFALSIIASFCTASLVFIVPIAMMVQVQDMKDDLDQCIQKCALFPSPVFDLFHAICCYLLPLVIILSVYMAILAKLYRHTRYSSVGRKTSISLSRVLKCSVMVVAFYFFCWTPYWCLRMYSIILDFMSPPMDYELPLPSNETTVCISANLTLLEDTNPELFQAKKDQEHPFGFVFWMYLLHAFPYTQSAFNWLFYAFLNRNLRNSSGRCSNAIRSAPMTSTLVDNGNSASQGRSPFLVNLQSMGSHLKSVGVDGGQALLRLSPFKSRSTLQSRSSSCIDGSVSDRLLPVPNRSGSVSKNSTAKPPDGKALSFNDVSSPQVICTREEDSKVSDSSVEWL